MSARSTKRGAQPKRRVYYMHMIQGSPATYEKGSQICYSVKTRPIRLARSLEQIKKEQALSDGWRNKRGYSVNSDLYGWRKVVLP